MQLNYNKDGRGGGGRTSVKLTTHVCSKSAALTVHCVAKTTPAIMETPPVAVSEGIAHQTQSLHVSESLHVPDLSEIINAGSVIVQSRAWSYIWSLPVFMLLLLWLLFLSCQQSRHYRKMAQYMQTTMQALQDLREVTQQAQGQDAAAPSTADLSSLENGLKCVDAKLLQLEQESRFIRGFVDQFDNEQTLTKIETLIKETLEQASTSTTLHKQWTDNVPPKIKEAHALLKEVHTFTTPLGQMNKAVAALALDCQKQFAMAETGQDGVLRQGREALQYTQNEFKALGERVAAVETTLEALRADSKQASMDLHVARTKLEQKADNIQQELNKHVGWSHSNMRGLNVVIPQTKDIQDCLKDLTGYAVAANKHDSEHEKSVLQILEAANNTENRLVHMEGIIGSLQQGLDEVGDILQQVREAQTLLQDNSRQILARTPKLQRRNPPDAPTATPSASAAPASPATEQASHPIRLSEHLQPVMPRDAANIYMMPNPGTGNLSHVPTSELLRTLLARGQF